MSDDRPLYGPGHNRPEPPRFELRRSDGVSCDWTYRNGDPVTYRRTQRYWRIYRDGAVVDSFLKKANAMKKLKRLKAEAAADG